MSRNIPLLLLHGALGSTEQVEPLRKQLEGSFEVHMLNFSGHGGKPATSDYSIALFTDDVFQYMDEHEILQVDIFGFSMGGYVALNLARLHPDKVRKICTLGTKFGWTPTSAAQEVKFLDPEKIAEKVPAFAAQLQHRHHPLNWKEVLKGTADMMIRLGNGEALTARDFSSVSHEVLLTLGEMDNMVTKEETLAVKNALPNAELKILPRMKHPIEQADIKSISTEVMAFMKN